MTRSVSFPALDRWVTANQESGHDHFTVTDLHSAARQLFPGHPIKRRMAYHICQQYVQILGIQPERRQRRNLTEIIFTAEQALQILYGMKRWSDSGQSYAEIFLEMRDASQDLRAGARTETPGARSTSGSPGHDLHLEQLLEEVRALRTEVADLRQGQAALLQSLSRLHSSALTREDLWRLSIGHLTLSLPDGIEHAEDVMQYLGVTDPEAEEQRLQMAGLEKLLMR